MPRKDLKEPNVTTHNYQDNPAPRNSEYELLSFCSQVLWVERRFKEFHEVMRQMESDEEFKRFMDVLYVALGGLDEE